MIMDIKLTYNKGFQWNIKGNLSYKGYFEPSIEDSENEIINSLLATENFDDFVGAIRNIHGCFSIIFQKNDEVWTAVDTARSIPLFFSGDFTILSDSAEEIRKSLDVDESDVDSILYYELLLKRNTKAGHTVYSSILQLEAGEAIRFYKNGCKRTHYFSHNRSDYPSIEKPEELDLLQVSNKMIRRTINGVSDRRIVLPLSGGYDSRFLACLLKENGFNNVLCYTYGRKDDYEVRNSRDVADKLGYRWYFVEYTDEKWEDFLSEKNKKAMEYFEYAHNHSSLPHIQEYIALNELLNQNIINSEDIIIPGFCGDVPAGSFMPQDSDLHYNIDTLVNYSFNHQFINFKANNKVEKMEKESLLSYYRDRNTRVKDADSFSNAYEEWITCGRLAMYVVNSLRVYEYFGLEWRIPMWDSEYLSYWYSVPNSFRKNCLYYQNTLFNTLFSKYDVAIKKPSASSTHSNIVKSVLARWSRYVLICISVFRGKDYYHRNNINNFNYASIIFYRKLKNKHCFQKKSLSVPPLEQLWWCELKYGETNMLDAF